MKTFTTQAAALAQSTAENREGRYLVRFVTDTREYQWLTDDDVEELQLYGYDDFEIVLDATSRPALWSPLGDDEDPDNR